MEIKTELIETNGIKLNVALAGPTDGIPILFLHGFPEFWYGWKNQLEFFASKGFRVIAPDQRGYNLSEKPKNISEYNIDILAKDATGLLDTLKIDKAVLVGHDWGASVSWWVANKYPERFRQLVILNVPHHKVMKKALSTSWKQRRKSYYFFLFQVPKFPEFFVRRGRFYFFRKSFNTSSKPELYTNELLQKYQEAWSQPYALRSMIHWYRALFKTKPERISDPTIQVPTTVIWGVNDPYLGQEMAQPSADLCKDGQLHFIENATHWVHHEEPEKVNKLILEFIS